MTGARPDRDKMIEGYQVSSSPRIVTLERMRDFSEWPTKSIHTDEETAKESGLPGPVAQGMMSYGYLSSLLIGLFGEDWFRRGKMSVSFIRMVQPGDTIIANATIRTREVDPAGLRLSLDVWCENQRGEKVTVGTATILLQ